MTRATKDLDNETGEATESLKEHRKTVRRRKAKKERNQDPSIWRDGVGFVAILIGIAWLLTLISYDPNDPSFLQEGTSKHIPDNLIGRVGANVAAFCYQLVGFGSFMFPLTAMYLGSLCIRSRKVEDWFFQIVGSGTILFVVQTFLGSFSPILIEGASTMPGGLVGVEMWHFFSGYLNPFGTYLFLFGTASLAFLVATQLRLQDIGMRLLQGFWRLQGFLGGLAEMARALWEGYREKQSRQRIIRRELKKMAANEPEPEPEPQHELAPEREDPMLLAADPDLLRDGPEPEYDDADIEVRSQDLDALALDEQFEEMPESEPAAVDPSHQVTPTKKPKQTDGIVVNPMKQTPGNTQESFQFVQEIEGDWVYPNSYFFNKANADMRIDEAELVAKAKALEEKLAEFSVTGQMKEIHPGPVVTTYEFRPDAGIKYSKIVNLSDDLCLALGAESIRIDRMPGRSSIGMEVPNDKRELITFREMIESDTFSKSKSKLLLSLGKTIDGTPFCADLAKMPHLLIAGQTGSGKSVGINAMICSILMRAKPDEVKLIMIDPKMVEMGIYADIPHLLTPVVIDPNEAANALKWAVGEMERRYKLLAGYKFRNLELFNKAAQAGEIEAIEGADPPSVLPLIVVLIDELADLMMVARGEVEESIARLAQKSRAIGIHLVLATQRPSVDIITGVIKSNLPSRLSYRVAQRNDSRIILDTNGAESLLGKGDGLFLGPGTARLVRIHAPYISETEVLDLVRFLKNQGTPIYNHQILKSVEQEQEADASDGKAKGRGKSKGKGTDEMYDKAARLVVRSGQASVSYLQRKLGLGYARAAKLVDMMEDDGIVGPNVGSKARDILVPSDYFDGVDSQAR
ncbi:DNA translocase FtsK [Acanthopleuribacter pedis]|uniref:DNA translocase FtsK n=1 Tax=Acanthopleuribacter pedis TaxID=442870 RepID=A0A8J7U5C8_9BACT|nr:DNA translocase FtsK [Acanthopleuribacter pedis]MBO1320308.1 DNA translocase FtsK [Acanthopleuribacter pedis]